MSDTPRRSVAAVLPLFNEGRVIADLVRRMPADVAETLVIDDGSTDDGPARAREAGANVIHVGRRRGVGNAIRTGLFAARDAGHDVAVVMAGNGKDDPAEIARLLEKLDSGFDYVQGSRFLAGGSFRNLPRGRYVMIRAYSLLFRLLTGFPATDVTNGFRAYRLRVLDDPRIRLEQEWLDGYELEYYMHYKMLTCGFRVAEVAVSKTYPGGKSYSKVRPVVDWWKGIRPVILLFLRIKS